MSEDFHGIDPQKFFAWRAGRVHGECHLDGTHCIEMINRKECRECYSQNMFFFYGIRET